MTVDSSWCTLKVDNAGMYALMCLHTHNSEEEHTISEKLVMEFLESQDIVHGINSIAIQSMIEHIQYEQYICVAQGKPATRGADGYYEYARETQDMKKKPLINEDGTADYKNSLNLAMISEGELLATYIPATEGESGCDVFGNEILALGKGKEALPIRGKGIRPDEDNIHYYAEYTGHIVMDGSKIYIDKLFRVNGDLDIEIGNIRFDGDVEVSGDVRSGLEIEVKGSIFVHGHVGASKLFAGQNITIEKGVQGRGICVISAKGDVACKFVESCEIYAEGSIYADSVLNSTLIADNQIIVTSKHGNVISSEVYGKAGVVIKEAGNSAGVPTLLRAGQPRDVYARANDLNQMIYDINNKLESFKKHLENLDTSEKENPNNPAIAETRTQIMRARIVLTSQKKECEEELAMLNARINSDKENSYINVVGTAYEGVRIYIGECPYIVPESVKEVTFRVCNGEVVMTSLDE